VQFDANQNALPFVYFIALFQLARLKDLLSGKYTWKVFILGSFLSGWTTCSGCAVVIVKRIKRKSSIYKANNCGWSAAGTGFHSLDDKTAKNRRAQRL
jgi:hypothetical protein